MNRVKTLLTASLALAITFTFSCSSGGDDDGNNNPGPGGGFIGDGRIITFAIKDITGTSFTAVETDYNCSMDGTLSEHTYEYPTSYTISGSTLSFGEAEFNGNSASLIGTWNALELQEEVLFRGNSSSHGIGGVSKAVFTQNTLTLTQCAGEPGYTRDYGDGVTFRVIDCGKAVFTKGNETVTWAAQGEDKTFTYGGKTCKFDIKYSEPQMREACSDAYNKAAAEGGYVYNYYYDILEKDENECLKDFPEWLH